jgi:NAD(P)H-dependent flavin oxidoreductase YrpB (nitropropane dioxygenase family)
MAHLTSRSAAGMHALLVQGMEVGRIASGQRVVVALSLGAQAVSLGTRCLVPEEASPRRGTKHGRCRAWLRTTSSLFDSTCHVTGRVRASCS